ncbi:MAG: hypothetical protein PHG89_05820 [Gallionella sp.]|nr:hypothetical protein [Gallionella sp.]
MKTSQNMLGGGALWPVDAIGLPLDEAVHCVDNNSGTTIFREGVLKINCNIPDFGLRLFDMQWEAPTVPQLFSGGR